MKKIIVGLIAALGVLAASIAPVSAVGGSYYGNITTCYYQNANAGIGIHPYYKLVKRAPPSTPGTYYDCAYSTTYRGDPMFRVSPNRSVNWSYIPTYAPPTWYVWFY